MKILKFAAENYMRLQVVEITPDGDLVVISGQNGAGKSSVLNAVWAALKHTDAKMPRPIRDGAEEAIIKLDMGELRVTRKFRKSDKAEDGYTTSLTVENADGSRPKSPQTILDDLMGKLTMDPIEFLRMKPNEQFEALKVFVPDFNFASFDGQNATDYEKRTDENRKAKELRAQAAGIQAPSEAVTKIDVDGLVKQLEDAGITNKTNAERRARRAEVERRVDVLTQDVADKKATIERLRAEIKDSEEIIAADTKRLKEAPPLPDDVDTKAVVDQISAAKAVNANAEAFARRAEIVKQAEFHEGVAEKLTEAMDARKTHKKAAIAAAKMPVEGLSLDEDGVMLNGRPFEQASDAERLRVSVAVAMAGDPTIRVLRVRDGERLDKNGLKLLAQMAKKANFQIFLEKVSDDGKTGVVLVEGRVESVNPVPV